MFNKIACIFSGDASWSSTFYTTYRGCVCLWFESAQCIMGHYTIGSDDAIHWQSRGTTDASVLVETLRCWIGSNLKQALSALQMSSLLCIWPEASWWKEHCCTVLSTIWTGSFHVAVPASVSYNLSAPCVIINQGLKRPQWALKLEQMKLINLEFSSVQRK